MEKFGPSTNGLVLMNGTFIRIYIKFDQNNIFFFFFEKKKNMEKERGLAQQKNFVKSGEV